jgi:hypothetical protein
MAPVAPPGFVLDSNAKQSGQVTLAFSLATPVTSAVLGSFVSTTGAPGPCAHAITPPAGCVLRSCPLDATGAGTFANAGTLTATGATTTPLMINRSARGDYLGDTGMLVAGGTSVSVMASGGEVPAFSVTTTVPPVAMMLGPTASATTGAVMADHAKGLTVTWMPLSDGSMSLFIDAQTDTASLQLECTAKGSDGTYTFSPSALATIPTTAINTAVSAVVFGTSATTMAGTWPVTFQASSPPLDASNNVWQPALLWQ